MQLFSRLENSFEDFIKNEELQKELKKGAVPPFPERECSADAQSKRVKEAIKGFWFFDKTYFPPDLYENYALPNKMCKDIIEYSTQPGYHFVIGPRKHGKTITAKKILLWLTITGRVKIAGVYAETLPKASAMLKDLYTICMNNNRLLYDFGINFDIANSDSLEFTISPTCEASFSQNPLGTIQQKRFIASFSEGRSVKGFTRLFGRPTFLLADDIETHESPMSASAVQLRIDKLNESYQSMNDNSTFLILANDFDTASAVHQLRLMHNQNLLPDNLHFHIYKAWEKNKPLWNSRYKVKTEAGLRRLIKPLSESDWQANYMANPIPPEGYFFLRKYYQEAKTPTGAVGVIYCDPNLSKKGKGDTTAITPLLYSAKTNCYYFDSAICKSYSDSNILLSDLIAMKQSINNITAIGFDGNVSQESTWTQHVRNYCMLYNIPYPVIEYKRYRVDDIAKNLQLAYNEGRVFFLPGFSKTEHGERFLNQFFAFTGKRNNNKDDAPDSAICAFEFIHERRIVKRSSQFIKKFDDYYKL